ncbi:unnamed protein product [Owenia fusiformis]|uniref:Uncharacterized protein n=1 Tax=Owenia fusiformis TaxID=6347 RepID=A0A8J1TV45_OWEFU|nr:unnamed protein product [Owenia fusiformis]
MSESTEKQPPPESSNPNGPSAEDISRVMNIDWLKTIPGILKAWQVVLGIIVLACVGSRYFVGGHQFFLFVASVCFIGSTLLFLFYLFRITEKLTLPWTFIDLIYSAGGTLLYFIASIVLAVFTYGLGNLIAGTVFSFMQLGCFGISTFFLFQDWRANSEASNKPNV